MHSLKIIETKIRFTVSQDKIKMNPEYVRTCDGSAYNFESNTEIRGGSERELQTRTCRRINV
jgi:hypothetical protein